jgi:hypothetical protein
MMAAAEAQAGSGQQEAGFAVASGQWFGWLKV